MKKLLSTSAIFLMIALCSTSCKKNMDQVNDNQEMNRTSSGLAGKTATYTTAEIQDLVTKLATKMDNKCVGYSFVVSYKGDFITSKSGGFSRTIKDMPFKSFSMTDKYSIASVSKTISAAALIKILNVFPGGINANLDMPMWTSLPSHWVMGPGVKTITYRQLLNHTSGLRYDVNPFNPQNGDDYTTLKNLMAQGIMMFNKYYSYNNRNFALMRFLIPKLAGYPVQAIPAGLSGQVLTILENAQGAQAAEDYKNYCRLNIFTKLGTTINQNIDCKMTDPNPSLCYTFPYSFTPGSLAGKDLTLTCGAQGWVLSTVQVSDFFTRLQYSNTIIPSTLGDLMKSNLLGYDRSGTLSDGTTFYWKNGIYDFSWNAVSSSYRSLIIGFSDDIQITIMANSNMNLQDAATAAHQLWHP